jgi:transposase
MLSNKNTVYIAIELSTSVWLVGTRLAGAPKSRMHRIDVGDTATLLGLVDELRTRPVKGTGRVPDLACCFEAGRDGFWLHRLLIEHEVPT